VRGNHIHNGCRTELELLAFPVMQPGAQLAASALQAA
jgi:hypothetical protein